MKVKNILFIMADQLRWDYLSCYGHPHLKTPHLDNLAKKGVTVRTMEETTNAIKQSCEDQKKGITTFIEVILNQELGEPFRRDAMKKPVKVAGISKSDMKPQKSLVS